MKKGLLTVIAVLLIAIGITVYGYFARPDGATVESREELLGDISYGENWKISTERTVEDHIVCGIYSANEKRGIAVFKPAGNGRYELFNHKTRKQNEIVVLGAVINQTWYDLVWFDGAQTEYAEIICTPEGGLPQTYTHDSRSGELFVRPAPETDYALSVVYYDADGNRYE